MISHGVSAGLCLVACGSRVVLVVVAVCYQVGVGTVPGGGQGERDLDQVRHTLRAVPLELAVLLKATKTNTKKVTKTASSLELLHRCVTLSSSSHAFIR